MVAEIPLKFIIETIATYALYAACGAGPMPLNGAQNTETWVGVRWTTGV
jgi:hypothetical protein